MTVFYIFARIINLLANLIVLVVVVDTVVSFFLSPYNSFRQTLDRLVTPILNPIRRVIPPVGMFDLSPLVLIILVEVISYVLTSLLYAL